MSEDDFDSFSDAEIRNLIQWTFAEAVRRVEHIDDFKFGFLCGIVHGVVIRLRSNPAFKEKYKNDLMVLKNHINKMIEEFVFTYQDSELEELDLDAILEELHKELEQKIDHVDAIVGDVKVPPDADAELDAVIKQLDEENQEEDAINKQKMEENSERYNKIYHQICDMITEKYDYQITQIDALEGKTWDDSVEKKEEIEKMKREVSRAVELKIRELLNDDMEDIFLFRQWIKIKEDDGEDGSNWWQFVDL